jgi:putative transposase
MVELRHASHCVYKIRYHMMFCVKYRKRILADQDGIEFLKSLCYEIGRRYWFEFDAIGIDGYHMHIFVGSGPKYAPSRFMQIIKSTTARELFKAFPEIKKGLWDGEFWSDGGYIGTVGEGITAEIIRDYIEKQGWTEEKESYDQMRLFEFE